MVVGGLVYREATGTIGTWEGANGRLGWPRAGSRWAREAVLGGGTDSRPHALSVDAVQSGPHMAPYSLLKDDVKWPPTLQPPVVLGPPAPDPRPLAPPPGNPAGFRELFPEVLEPGPLAASLPPASEQLLPDLLISPHMLPRKDPRLGTGKQCWGIRVGLARRVEGAAAPWEGKVGELMGLGLDTGLQNGEARGSRTGWACLLPHSD